jgi:signal transduction histidine kinase/CheY-like chemotaxis protein
VAAVVRRLRGGESWATIRCWSDSTARAAERRAWIEMKTSSELAAPGNLSAQAVVSRDGTISAWNAGLTEYSGWPAAGVLGRPLAELLVPLDPPALPDLQGMGVGQSWSGLVALVRYDSRAPVPATAELEPLPDGGQLLLGLAPLPSSEAGDGQRTVTPPVVVRVDSRRGWAPLQAEADLPDGLWRAVQRLHEEDSGGDARMVAERYQAVFRDRCAASFCLALAEGEACRRLECHLIPEPGTDTVLGVFRDATACWQAEVEAHQNEQRLGAILAHVPGFYYSVDRNFVFTASDGAGLTALKLAPGELVGTSLLELWGTKDPSYEPFACQLRTLAGLPQTYQDVCMGRSLEYRLRPLRDREGKVVGVLGVALDVTEREHAKEEQVKLAAQLRQAQKLESIGRLAGGVAHDFNNLLTCMMGHLTLAGQFVPPDSPVAGHLGGALDAMESAATLTRQLLAFGRKQVINPRPLNLSGLIDRVEGMLQRLIGEDIVLRTHCAADLWRVHADPGQLEQILVNLIVNARDAITGHGEIVVETGNRELALPMPAASGTLAAGKYVVLTVRDSGRGMSDAVRAKLFEPFFTTKEMGAGTGLGLATVYGAVVQNGGTVTVESQLGEGTTFRIFLPMLDAEPSSISMLEPSSPPQSAASRGGTETILFVEDEPLVLELAHCALQQLGYRVLPCGSPDEALRALAEHQDEIDLLVTDVVMPRMNGKELAARIGALRPSISVLFCSGFGEHIIAQQGVIDAGLHFIAKPYRPAELAAKVRAVLDQRAGGANEEAGPLTRPSAGVASGLASSR